MFPKNPRFIGIFLLVSLLAVAVGAAISAVPASAAVQRSYFAERYDVTIDVQPGGTLLVTETVRFRFEGGPYTFVFRELAENRLDDIQLVEVAMDGQPLPEGDAPGAYEITDTDPLEVTWHFSPASDTSHDYTLTYRVLGAVRQNPDGDTILWRAVPEEHEYTIQRSDIRITYPADIEPLNAPSADPQAVRVESGSGETMVTMGPIDDDEPVDVSIRFPAGSLIDTPPAWQAAQMRRAAVANEARPYGLGGAALAGLLGIAGIFAAASGFRRDAADVTTFNMTSPPRDLPPALAARLTGSSTGFLGTLFDLAQRGFLRIEEGPKKWGSRSFEVVQQAGSGPLAPHESAFLAGLFKKSDRVALSAIGQQASNQPYSAAVDQELQDQGWLDASRKARRSRFMQWTALALVLGLFALMAGLIGGSFITSDHALVPAVGALVGVGAALIVVGLIGLIAAAVQSPLSDEGVRQAAAWNSFKTYLQNVARGREEVQPTEMFERYLPHAAAFGIADAWGKSFQTRSEMPIPTWIRSVQQAGTDDASFIVVLAAINSANTSASSSGGAAGGASGGGASGAG